MILNENLSSLPTGKIKSANPIKITIDNTLPRPNIHQYPLRPDALEGAKPITQYYLKRGLCFHVDPLQVSYPFSKGTK